MEENQQVMSSNQDEDYRAVNRNSWNQRTAVHIDSEFYDNKSFIAGRNSLKNIELKLLGNVEGKRILHLQCHFGQDSISLPRLGAVVTGVDLSDKAIIEARALAKTVGVDCRFICSDLFELPDQLNETFDVVFTTYGTIAWLPDLDKWASIVSRFLKPGGQFVFVEFHPVVWMFDDDLKEVAYSYFQADPIVEIEAGTYANKEANINQKCITWNHGIGEVVTALLKQNIQIKSLEEFDYANYPALANAEEFEPGKYRVKHFGNKIPLLYAIEGQKAV